MTQRIKEPNNIELQNLRSEESYEVKIVTQPKEKKFNIALIEFVVALILCVALTTYHFTNIAIILRESNEDQPMHGIEISWLGLYHDNSDGQWSQFRNNLPIFLLINLVFLILSYLIKLGCTAKFDVLRMYQIVIGVGLLFFLFRSGAILWVIITLLYYGMTKVYMSLMQIFINYKCYPQLMWGISLPLLVWLYYNEYTLFRYVSIISPDLSEFLIHDYKSNLISWNNHFNMTLLRILSYSFDKYWAQQGYYKIDIQRHLTKCTICKQGRVCYKVVSETNAANGYDSIVSYYAYLLYAPLFITGPIITFNGFINQVKQPQNQYAPKQIILYTLRALINVALLEMYCHFTFCPSLMKKQNFYLFSKFTAAQTFIMGLSQLTFIWLKFLTIWRLARAVALIDGVDSPENMNRCVFNNYCFEGFWRSWHRSFNQWLIRYIYIPLGGNKRKLLTIWAVFTFVAIWHDCQINLLLWAWFICLCLLPEIAIKHSFSRSKLWDVNYFKYVVAVVGSCSIVFLMITNLIGFGYGWEQMKVVLLKYLDGDIVYQLLITLTFFMPITFVQFWVRDKQDVDY